MRFLSIRDKKNIITKPILDAKAFRRDNKQYIGKIKSFDEKEVFVVGEHGSGDFPIEQIILVK